jgi:lysophospholipase L1-like esterase
MNWETLMCLGDSITIGARSYCSYPEYAAAELEKEIGNHWIIINHATSGFTAIDLSRSITANFNNLKKFQPSIITVLIGTNDVKSNVPSEDFEIALNQIVLKAKLIVQNKNVVLMTLPFFPEGIMYPYKYGMNSKIEEFNTIIKSMAKKHGIRTTSFEISTNDLFDGVHLNSDGAKKVGRQLCDYILKDKGIYQDIILHIKKSSEGS